MRPQPKLPFKPVVVPHTHMAARELARLGLPTSSRASDDMPALNDVEAMGSVEVTAQYPPLDDSAAQDQTPQPQQQQQAQPQPESSPHQPTIQYDSLPATAVAHHGLQVLEAVSNAAPATTNPLAQQYAQSASLHVAEAAAANSQPQHSQYPPIPSVSLPIQTPTHMPVEDNGAIATPAQSTQKVTRLRRACDMCSQRKVKCDESGPPCKPCRDLNVECTFQREMKRRGPPNKHAEAAKAKRARVDNSSDLSPTPQNAAHALVSIAGLGTALDAEVIAPWPVLTLLVDDFFTYMHPLMPFPHEPSFRQALQNRADRTSSDFLALLASMVGVLVASFPRSARARLEAQHSTNLFPTAINMIDHCHKVAVEAKGSSFLTKEDITVDDAATAYFLGLAAAYTLQWQQCKLFFTLTMAYCRALGIHRPPNTPPVATGLGSSMDASSMNMPVDHIKDQIGKRIFWVMVAGLRSMTQLSGLVDEVPLPPPTTEHPFPDMPLEVDDQYIFMDRILGQPEGSVSLITGFNHNVGIYFNSMNELTGVDMCYGINFFEWSAQKTMLSNALKQAKAATDSLPLQIKVDLGQNVNEGAVMDDPNFSYCPPIFPSTQPPDDVRHALAEDPARRRNLQLEIQKANIYASQLATRSYIVERYFNLLDIHRSNPTFDSQKPENQTKDGLDISFNEERELIVQNLLTVLTSITQRNMEPNGASLVNKIRQVASTLLNDAPERKGPVAIKAEEYLAKFVDILLKLDQVGAAVDAGQTANTMTGEEELKHWASLRDYQIQFIANGGFLGN